MSPAEFLFTICQHGAEQALKDELARGWPEMRFAFSRPGFLTFKLPASHSLADDVDLRCVFARTHGFSLGNLRGSHAESLAEELWRRVGDRPVEHLHVWQRDAGIPGDHGFEPGPTALAAEVGRIIAGRRPPTLFPEKAFPINLVAPAGRHVLDCVLVEPDEWWIGYHRTATLPSRWPGGTPKIDMPPEAVSRAYLKVTEALLWSRLPVLAGDHCVEIGSAPGGSCQALLDRGLIVTGIDPADMDPIVLEHPRFTHVKARGADLKRREFRHVQWLLADSNVAPKHTLDTVEHIVTNRQVNVRGVLLTLKLLDWQLAEHVSEYLERIRSWGYPHVRARQLAFNRQEICVTAQRQRPRRPTSGG